MTRSQDSWITTISRTAVTFSLIAVAGCGGGGGGNSGTVNPTPNPNVPAGPTYTAGIFEPSTKFADQCANPRTGNDSAGKPFPDTRGSVLTENHWLRSWTNELYLWYREVPDLNPANFGTAAYFEQLKTPQTTPSGAPKDQFHFTVATADWESFSQSGVTAGYGITVAINTTSSSRQVTITLVEAGTPAANAGLLRGDQILTIDGVDINSNNVTALNNGLFPTALDQDHSFQIRSTSGATKTITMRSSRITTRPVHTVKTLDLSGVKVGYILFNDHIATAETQLIDAINTLKPQNISDLVLDLRYNGGGYLAIASQLSYMIGGSSRTSGQVFERTIFNDKHPATNPVTNQPLQPTPFITTTIGLSATAGAPLPTLNLNRVFVLTSEDTCSASESIINGLRGVGVPVIQIGTTTCGKPYGFYDFDNCGTTYFSIQFKGVNAKNFGDYADGFIPTRTTDLSGANVEGCSVADDFTKQLGDPTERMLKTALDYRANGGTCTAPPAAISSHKLSPEYALGTDGGLRQPQWRQMRILDSSAY